MKVKIEANISNPSCGCKNWIEYWEEFTNDMALECSVVGCTIEPEVGGHVSLWYDGESSINDTFIVPLCKKHSETKEEELDIGDTELISAHAADTCRKQ